MFSEAPIDRSVVIKNTISAVQDVCERILAELKARQFGEDDIFAIHLAFEEACFNALKHGNKMDSQKEIKIDYLISSDKVDISIEDQGSGFKPELVPDPRCGDNIYKVKGRGLLLIRSYMDSVKYNQFGNCLQMVKHKCKSRK